jgi:hypothetical protein
MNFTEQIKQAKPNIAESTVKSYNTVLKTIYKNVFEDTDKPNIENFKNVEKILNYIKDEPIGTRKAKLSAVMALAPLEEYKTQISQLLQKIQSETNKSEMTAKLEESEITPTEMAQVVKTVKQNADAIQKKSELTMRDLQEIQKYVIVSLYHGHIAPRRSIDFTEMVLKPTDKKTQNYIDMKKGKFVFNNYKTAGTYGMQEIEIPPALKKILKKWIILIPDDVNHLLFNNYREPLSNVSLGQRFNEIFGPNKSVNSMRHYFLTQNHSNTVLMNDRLSDDMTAMGSNPRQVKSYVKVNPAKGQRPLGTLPPAKVPPVPDV